MLRLSTASDSDEHMQSLKVRRHQKMGLYRTRPVLQSVSGVQRNYDHGSFISFCSNDYLGLAQHPDVIRAFKQAADEYGIGSGASHFLGAYSRVHYELEEALAEFTGHPRALVFSTGYMGNLGLLSALVTKHDGIFGDKRNHASLLDSARLSGVLFKRYQHSRIASLTKQLSQSPVRHAYIVTDGVFSMDGDLAVLPELSRVAQAYSATLIVDDAHGLGVLGEGGRGISEHFGLKLDILSGGFGKALGCFGGFVAGSTSVIEQLLQFSRPYMYTTALPPAIAKAVHTSLLLLQKEGWRREKLHQLIARFRAAASQLALPVLPSQTPIQPLVVGEPDRAMQLAAYLSQRGFLVYAIRPPTVPGNTSRLRISLSALHDEREIDQLLEEVSNGLKLLNP